MVADDWYSLECKVCQKIVLPVEPPRALGEQLSTGDLSEASLEETLAQAIELQAKGIHIAIGHWNPLLWNLRMWCRSRGWISYYQKDRSRDRWLSPAKYRRMQEVNQAYEEYRVHQNFLWFQPPTS